MAEKARSIFTKKASEKLRNPDDMDRCIKVTSPGVWMALAACIALLVGLLSWGVFGTVITSVFTTGVVANMGDSATTAALDANAPANSSDVVICFLSANDLANVSVGDEADVNGELMKVAWIAPVPDAPGEWEEALGSKYLVNSLFNGDWAYPVWLEGNTSQLPQDVPLSVGITTKRVAPISLILKNWG